MTSVLFNLDFANNTVFSYFFLFFLIIDSYFLIPAVIAKLSNPTAELIIHIGISIKEEKIELETHLVTNISKCGV